MSISEKDRVQQCDYSSELNFSLDDITDGWWSWDIDSADVYMSPKFKALFGYKNSELANTMEAWRSIIYPEDYERAVTSLESHVKYGTAYYLAARYYHKSGSTIWVICRGHSEPTHDGTKVRIIGTHTDITPLKDSEYRLNITANYDSLTRLPNRHFFMSSLSKAVEKAEASQSRMAVLFLDIDNFKSINDSFGHAVGDEVLQKMASRMALVVRSFDFVARLCGDEFGFIIGGISNTDEAKVVCQRYLSALREPLFDMEATITATVSIGVAVYPEAGLTAETLLQHADMAMYSAKRSGRDSYLFFTEALGAALVRKAAIRSALQTAIAQEELSLVYQPVVDLEQEKVVGVEALLRWETPVLGQVTPSEFIPIAEESNDIIALGRWCFEKACHDFSTIVGQENPSNVFLSVNVSMRQLCQVGFAEFLLSTLARYQLDVGQLIVELTESAVMRQPEQTVNVLTGLAQQGVRFALDDFGVEYSSLKYLKQLPITALKIDQSFMENTETDPYNIAIVNAIVALANSLELTIIAEGVTSTSTVQFLQHLRCKLAQGFHFSRPLSVEQLQRYL